MPHFWLSDLELRTLHAVCIQSIVVSLKRPHTHIYCIDTLLWLWRDCCLNLHIKTHCLLDWGNPVDKVLFLPISDFSQLSQRFKWAEKKFCHIRPGSLPSVVINLDMYLMFSKAASVWTIRSHFICLWHHCYETVVTILYWQEQLIIIY